MIFNPNKGWFTKKETTSDFCVGKIYKITKKFA